MCIRDRFIGDGYQIKANSWCSPYRDTPYPTLSQAKRQCSNDLSCSMFTDNAGEGDTFYLCYIGAEIKRSPRGSILHIKRSEYICICKPFRKASNSMLLILYPLKI